MNASTAKPKTVGDWVSDVLRDEILSGKLRQGEPIRQDEIANRLGVSRMPVRETIRRLAAEGWIEDRPNRVALVARLDPDDARELFAIRAELECLAVRRSFVALERPDIDAIEAAHDVLRTASRRSYVVRHKNFHMALYRKAGRRLQALVDHHMDACERYLRFERTALEVSEEDSAEHRALYEAATRRDVETVTSILRAHIGGSGDDIACPIETRSQSEKRP